MSVALLVLAAIAVIVAIVLGVIAVRHSTLSEPRTRRWLFALAGAALVFAPGGVAFGVFRGDLDSTDHLGDVVALSTMIVTYWMRLLSCQITFIYWSNHSALIDFQVFFIHGNLLPPRKLTKRRAVPATYGCPNLTIIS